MQEKELTDDEWDALITALALNRTKALEEYTPPVKLTHGTAYIIYEKGNDNDSSTD